MDWLDDTRVIKITEQVYRGIMCKHVEGNSWKLVIGDEEYLFPNWHDTKVAIDRIHADCGTWYGGEKLKKK